jgi:hypothetical protein
MSEPAKNWISTSWLEGASLRDDLRSLRGEAEILDALVENSWQAQDGKYEGLLLMGRTINQATNAIEARLEGLAVAGNIGRDKILRPCRTDTAEEKNQPARTRAKLHSLDSEGTPWSPPETRTARSDLSSEALRES